MTFSLSQVWVEGAVMVSKFTRYMCNLPIKINISAVWNLFTYNHHLENMSAETYFFFELNNRRRQSNFDVAYEWIHYHVCHSSTFSSNLMSNRRKRSFCRHKEHASLTLMKKNWATNQIQQKVTQNHFMHLWLFLSFE